MKNCILTTLTIIIAFFTGCKTMPTVESMTNLGLTSGYTASIVLNTQTKMDVQTRTTITTIVTEVQKFTPETNSTYTVAWTPIAQKYVNQLVAEQKITQMVGNNVMVYFGYITNLLDLYIEKKGIREYQELVDAFIHGFCDSFLMNFRSIALKASSKTEIDEFTYETLMKNFK